MALFKSLDAITEQDLQALVDQQEPESKTIDYKVALNLSEEEAKAEFRRDVTSFANALGGDLVIGIKDKKGIPEELSGFDLGTLSQEQYKLRIQEILQSRIKPRIQGIALRFIGLTNGKNALIIRVPKSFAAPHQVEVESKDFQFWYRHDSGKHRMDIDDIRNAILSTGTLSERINQFRLSRLGKIIAGETPVPISESPKIVLHLIPLSSFNLVERRDLSFVLNKLNYIAPIYGRVFMMPRYNFNGMFSDDKYQSELACHSYVQLFHNGIVESVEGRLFSYSNGKLLNMGQIEELTISALSRYLEFQEQIGIVPPVLVMLSLLKIEGYSINWGDVFLSLGHHSAIRESELIIPEEIVNSFEDAPDQILRPVFDQVWNASGWPRSQCYDEQGNRLPSR